MNLELIFAEAYDRAAGACEALLLRAGSGSIISIDIGGSFFDALASNFASVAGLEYARSPSLVRYASQLHDYQFPLRPVDVVSEPTVFGHVDGEMRVVDDGNTIRNSSLQLDRIATRSIDSWMNRRTNVRWIHFGDNFLVLDQISGASRTIAHDRPIITTYAPADRPLRSTLFSALHHFGYDIFDLAGQIVGADGEETALGFGWIAVPGEQEGTRIFEPLQSEQPLNSILDRRHLELHSVPRHRRSGDFFGLSKVARPSLGNSLGMGDVAVCNDAYQLECDTSRSWRWLGPGSRSRIAVPMAFPGSFEFEAMLIGCRIPAGMGGCRILVEGREVSVSVQGVDCGSLRFVGYLDPRGYRGYAEIDFIAPGSPPPAGQDPRVLRVNLASILVAPCS